MLTTQPRTQPSAGFSRSKGSSMKRLLHDRMTISVPSQREYTANGYLKVPGRVALAGNVQQYLASELGLTDRPPSSIVKVYRPPESVFDPASLNSYATADITVEHPDEMVDAVTYRRDSVGHTLGPGRPEGDGVGVIVDLIFKDETAIEAVEDGKSELSAGYVSEYTRLPGVSPSGESYEFVQGPPEVNHIALCDQARAGRTARLFDHKTPLEAVMSHKVTLDSGVKIEVADEASAVLIQTTLDSLRNAVRDAEEAKTEAEAEKAKAEAKADALDEENEELKEKASEDSISKRLADVLAVTDAARKLAGTEFTCDSVSPLEIKRAALASRLPKRDWAGKSEAYVSAAWDSEMEKKEAEGEEEEDEKAKTTDSHRQLGQDLGNVKVADAQTTLDAAYQARMERTANAWKGN